MLGQHRVKLRRGFRAEGSFVNLLDSGALRWVMFLTPVGHPLANKLKQMYVRVFAFSSHIESPAPCVPRKCLAKRTAEAVYIASVANPGIFTALLRRGMLTHLFEINRNAMIEVALLL